ncbi:DUF6199 family natural product biosynthesis protein [Paenibacillus sp. GCM10027628]|uniref:DUF6199 family natural product biosynthesis protein n=1 Tax=Paenibacillus sp. GCM10027628 TaxID=3273413 RepID=UPI00362B912B
MTHVPAEISLIMIFPTIVFILWLGGSLFIAIAPYTFWKITQSWKAVKEPPKVYFVMQRIMGILFATIGISFWVFVLTRH